MELSAISGMGIDSDRYDELITIKSSLDQRVQNAIRPLSLHCSSTHQTSEASLKGKAGLMTRGSGAIASMSIGGADVLAAGASGRVDFTMKFGGEDKPSWEVKGSGKAYDDNGNFAEIEVSHKANENGSSQVAGSVGVGFDDKNKSDAKRS